MKLTKILPSMAMILGGAIPGVAQEVESWRDLTIFDRVTFYDGYEEKVKDADKDDGILRHTNYLYAVKLTEDQLNWFGEDLKMEVQIGAVCDNYDRIGNITLALVPKGAETYSIDQVDRYEIGRFITPFMNKNKTPTSVPYEYNVPALSLIMRDRDLRDKYDYWVEFEVFGIPYSAQQQIRGCLGRTDVFLGSLSFMAQGDPAPLTDDNVLVPIVMKTTEIFGPKNFNSYTEGACDVLGIPAKTYTFTLPEDVADARIILVTSNHGANEGGEEYIHRHHFVYVDGEIAYDYTPGGVSCEPYRQYNTQGNGIYGTEPDYDYWYNYSNWCPGQAVPIREVHLGAMNAGEHTMKLSVPDAEFVDDQGDFYVSAYLQGAKKGVVPSSTPEIVYAADFEFTQKGSTVYFSGKEEEVAEVAIYDYDGSMLYGKYRPGDSVSLDGFNAGVYIISARTADGRASVYKAVVR